MDKRKRRLLCMLEGSGRKSRWISGAPPLSFKAFAAGALENYRIFGNTVDGESVGDLVTSGQHAGEYKVPVTVEGKNLFDGEFLQGYWAGTDGSYIANYPTWICTDKLPCKPNTAYTLSFNSANSRWYGFFWFAENGDYILSDTAQSPQTQCHYTATSPSNAAYMAIDIAGYPDVQSRITPSDVTDFMLVEGTTPLPYEPYHAPVTTPIYIPEPIKMVGDEAEYIDYGEQKQHRVRKNLLPNTATSRTINGVTFTVNSDYSVTCNGTATARTFLTLGENISYPFDTILSGCPQGGSNEGYCLRVLTMDVYSPVTTDFGSGALIPSNIEVHIGIRIENGFECNNLEFTPMIRKADISDDTYEPYIENTDLDVILPALPTLPGTNVLSVGTAVQPSEIEVKGKIKAL